MRNKTFDDEFNKENYHGVRTLSFLLVDVSFEALCVIVFNECLEVKVLLTSPLPRARPQVSFVYCCKRILFSFAYRWSINR